MSNLLSVVSVIAGAILSGLVGWYISRLLDRKRTGIWITIFVLIGTIILSGIIVFPGLSLKDVRGVVLNIDTLTPISNAKVRLQNRVIDETDANGQFIISSNSVGLLHDNQLQVDAEGYPSHREYVSINSSNQVTILLSLPELTLVSSTPTIVPLPPTSTPTAAISTPTAPPTTVPTSTAAPPVATPPPTIPPTDTPMPTKSKVAIAASLSASPSPTATQIAILARELSDSREASQDETVLDGPNAPSDIPGLPITRNTTITSVVDEHTKVRDVYAVELAGGDILRLAVSSTHLFAVYVYKPDAVSVNSDDHVAICNQNRSCDGTYAVGSTGTYHIVISARESGVAYTMKVVSDNSNPLPQVPDDIPGLPIETNTTVTSVVDEHTKKRDVYAVELSGGETLYLGVSSTHLFVVDVYKPGAVSVNSDAKVALCPQGRSCEKSYSAAVAGTYYIVVSARESGVAYTMNVVSDDSTALPQVPDDIPGLPIETNTSVTSVVDEDAKVRDVYAVELRGGETLRLGVSSTHLFEVYIYKPEAITVNSNAYVTICRQNRSCEETYTAGSPGTYYIVVRARESGVMYTINIFSVP